MKKGKHIRASIKPIQEGDWVQVWTETGELEGDAVILRYNPYDDSFMVHMDGDTKGNAKIRKLEQIKPKEY
jgi:acyl CoA:acetate/3-ketoacid CoA transferase alpha subunit|tara:strand:+ start:1934 stop:2146 length:213 start_codon:yes stop_codon:yes gene_type:complete